MMRLNVSFKIATHVSTTMTLQMAVINTASGMSYGEAAFAAASVRALISHLSRARAYSDLRFAICAACIAENIPAWINNGEWVNDKGEQDDPDLNKGECAVGIWL